METCQFNEKSTMETILLDLYWLAQNKCCVLDKQTSMDGSTNSSSVQLSSGKISGGGSGGGSGGKDPVFQEGLELYLGPNGDTRRSWRFIVSPLSTDTNALLLQSKKNGLWNTSQVFLARET